MTQDKSTGAFRTISEVAEDMDLPQHVLRFWETRFPQIRPMKRGGGRRFYRPEDVELLRGIRYLLYVKGFTIKGVQRILKENGPRFVVAIGTGDIAALEQISAGRQPAQQTSPTGEPHLPDLELVTPPPAQEDAELLDDDEIELESKPRSSLTGFLKKNRVDDRDGGPSRLPRQSIETLETVILDLLECKRLLDQVR